MTAPTPDQLNYAWNTRNTAATLSGEVTGAYNATTVSKLIGKSVSTTAPTSGQFLSYNGANWTPASVSVPTLAVLSPSGVGATDVQNAIAACAAMSGVGEVHFGPGSFFFPSALNLSAYSNLIISCHPNTNLVAAMANGTGQANAPLYAGASLSSSSALTSNTTLFSDSISIADRTLFPKGSTIAVGKLSTNRFAYYTVISNSATGAGAIQVDRPILWAFTSANDSVFLVTQQPRNIRIYGNGATISGTGDRAIELSGVSDCLVEDFRIDASTGFGGIIASSDIGSLRSVFRKLTIQGGYGAQGGLALESAEDCLIDDCRVSHATTAAANPGISILDCMASVVRACSSSKNVVGLELNYGGSPGEGTKRAVVSGCQFFGNSSHGIQIINGSAEVQVESTQCRGNGGNGVYIANNATGVQLVATNCSDNTGSGVQATAGSSWSAIGLVATNNGACGVDTGADAIISDANISGNAVSHGIQLTGAADLKLTNSTISPLTTNGVYATGFFHSSTGVAHVSNCKFVASGTGTKAYIQLAVSGATLYVDNVLGTGGSDGIYTAGGTILCRGANVDVSAATTPYTITSTTVVRDPNGYTAITYSASMTAPALCGTAGIIATNGTAFTINAPSTPLGPAGTMLTFDIKNSSGGAMGAVTWNASFLLAGAFTNPANTKRRTITFRYDGTNWVELNRAAADI